MGCEIRVPRESRRTVRPCSLPLLEPGICSTYYLFALLLCQMQSGRFEYCTMNQQLYSLKFRSFSCSSGPQLSRASLCLQVSSLQTVLRYESRQLQYQAWVTPCHSCPVAFKLELFRPLFSSESTARLSMKSQFAPLTPAPALRVLVLAQIQSLK